MNNKTGLFVLVVLVFMMFSLPLVSGESNSEKEKQLKKTENEKVKIPTENKNNKKQYPLHKFIGRPPPDNREDPTLETLPSPIFVAMKSMLIPGWGQFTNKKYVKGFFFLGLQTAAVMTVMHLNQVADERYEQHLYWSELSTRALNNGNLSEYEKLQNLADDRYNKYTQNYLGIRNVANTALVIWLLCSADAYIDAHLRRFMETKKISTDMKIEDSHAKLELSFKF